MEVTFELNGTNRTVDCPPYETLLTLLRREGMVSVRFGSTSALYSTPDVDHLVRFCFCKKFDILEGALDRLRKYFCT